VAGEDEAEALAEEGGDVGLCVLDDKERGVVDS
jgi:hypothetical protein